jgi:hypothetical protein
MSLYKRERCNFCSFQFNAMYMVQHLLRMHRHQAGIGGAVIRARQRAGME